MDITKYYMTKNPCYVAGVKFRPKGIIIHSTGANNPYLKRYIGPDDGVLGVNEYGNHWNRPEYDRACVHAFIGKDKNGIVRAYQTLPWDMRGWHAGVRAGNDQYIGFEICEDGLYNITYLKQCFDMAVDLCTHICREMSIDVKDIVGHYEAHELGMASNHADPRHWFSRWGLSMDILRMKVSEKLKEVDGDEVNPVTVRISGKTNRIPAIDGVPNDPGRTYIQLRAFADALGIKFAPLDGKSWTSGVIVSQPECTCEGDRVAMDEVKRALSVLAKYMGV